ncbi:SusC/RagA family TonB-linked outer membrane protein [Chitinophaga pinensis]|uniref:TonB-dependent receptor plug n=1 Tax=Chitinophaga pinensis (strain ATCC 43595 / DSM 2588 / LMG 13176 / NBRC 15968 / NCIMB 11800 / UQM 2034) TaxID=485918 RepID=A0A979GU41_CHIPD|nr:SusC/RagA family TonB-linked outer membrane protein [Chitinophaga pinensis]ACU64192.1 TonB-dependent receptor plug [Chitinophaga pinensis DSM 2588]
MFPFYQHLSIARSKAVLCLLLCCVFSLPFTTVKAGMRADLHKVPCSLTVHNKPLEEVFELIEQQTHYAIICVDQSGLMDRKVNLNARNTTLENVLQQLAGQVAFNYKCLDNNIIVKAGVVNNPGDPAEKTVSGKVTDAKKQPLPGVSIMVKGTKRGTISTDNGDFQIKANEGEVLQFFFTGFQPYQLTVGKGEIYQVTLLDDEKKLSEVLVTALGIKKEKAKVGYSAQEVKGADLVKAREPNVISSLTGRVAGLTIRNTTDLFQDPGISLRGAKPLIVIDGIPDQSADLYKINADDIESMTVLKGASASALYGSIGYNGAIMITTKRGGSKDLSVDFNSSTQFQTSFIRIPKVQTTYGNGFKGEYEYIDGSGSGPEGFGWIWGPKLDQRDPSTPSGYHETPQFNSPVDPTTGKLVPLPFLSRGKDNVKNFFRTGVITSNNISFTKSGDNGTFRASASHIYQQGIVPNTDLKNTSFNMAGNYNLTKNFSINGRISYNKEYTHNFPETGYGPTNYLYNLILWTGPDIDVRDLRNYWVPGKEGIQQRHYNISYYNNPYFQAYEYLRGYDKNNSFGSVDLDYKISPSFSAKFRTGINQYSLNRNYNEPKSYIGYGNKSRGQYTITSNTYFDVVSDLIVDYNHTFSEHFKVHAQAGGSNYYRNFKAASSNTDGLTIPGLYNLGNSANAVQSTNSLEERRTASVYGIVDVELYNAIYLSLTGRNDKISRLPVENNSFFYPSLSGSVVISQLTRLPEWFSFLKARGAVSRVSSGTLDDSYTYGYLPSYDKGTTWDGVPGLKYKDIIMNASLHPQTSDSWEAGVDAKFFGNKLGFELTYFQTKDYNNILSIPVSLGSGFASRLENGHVYQRRGVEFVTTATPIRKDKFRWDVMLNLSTYRRHLKEITGGNKLGYLKAGDRTDRIFANVYQKDPSGNIIYRADGFPLEDNIQRFVGNSDPDLIYGLENSFSYGNFTLRFLVDGRLGGLMYSTTNQKMWWGGTHPGTVNQFRDDANDNKSTFVGKGVVVTSGQATYDADGNIVSDNRTFAPNTQGVNYIDYMTNTSNGADVNYNYYSQSFLKLRELTLTYRVPSKWLKGRVFRAADISAVGRNLLLFAKIPNVDPDSGVDNLQTPSTRSIGVNLNLKF